MSIQLSNKFSSYFLFSFFVIILLLITACEEQQTAPIGQMQPLFDSAHKPGTPGPWQVMTVNKIPVTYYHKRVFIDKNSVFVLADGTPIRTVENKRIMLDINSKIRSEDRGYVRPSEIFENNKRAPVKDDVSFIFNGY